MLINNMLVFAFILLFIIIFLLQSIDTTPQILPGFWEVSEEFKEQAKIDQLCLYFDEGDGYLYDGYMIMDIDGESAFNGPLKYKITPKGYFKCNTYTFETEIETPLPKKMEMEIYCDTGLMVLKSSSNTIYAKLFKNNQLSAKTVLKLDTDNFE